MALPDTPSKSTNWKVIIPGSLIVVLCCLCLVILGVLAYLGTRGNGPLAMLATDTLAPTGIPTNTPTQAQVTGTSLAGAWVVSSSWNCTGDYDPAEQSFFYSDTTFYVIYASVGGTWYTDGDYVDFTFDEYPNSHYVGTLSFSGDYMEGTMDNLDDLSGCWHAYKIPAEDFLLMTGGAWILESDWGCTGDSDEVEVVFLSDYTFQAVIDSDTLTGTWSMTGDNIEFIFDEYPNADYVGTLDPDSQYLEMEGTMSDSAGDSGCWFAWKNNYGGD